MIYQEGDPVLCGFCGRGAGVESITFPDGIPRYYLSCGHSNAWCEKHQQLTQNIADSYDEVQAFCEECSTEELAHQAEMFRLGLEVSR